MELIFIAESRVRVCTCMYTYVYNSLNKFL